MGGINMEIIRIDCGKSSCNKVKYFMEVSISEKTKCQWETLEKLGCVIREDHSADKIWVEILCPESDNHPNGFCFTSKEVNTPEEIPEMLIKHMRYVFKMVTKFNKGF